MARLFGTDGVRGLANKFPLDGNTVFRIAQLATRQLMLNHKKQGRPVFIAKDTRRSGDMLEHVVAAGVASMGAEARLLGVLPTPSVAFITRELQGMGGVMLSASHNPFFDNGIKIFGADGYKISDAVEETIEKDLIAGGKVELPTGAEVGFVSHDDSSASFWLSNLARVAGENVGSRRLKIALDCANGALARWAPKFFADLGYSVDAIGVNPDGVNINDGCGSTCIASILNVMKKEHFDVGFSFDGDADRVIAISSDGDVIDGDFILAITAKYLKDREKLPGNALVTTVMANLGLDLAMRNNDIKVFKTRVGDRYVLEEMQKNQAVVGGEQSGHIILAEHATTGDGLLTACNLLRIMRETGATIKELSGVMSKLPQVLVNIRVKTKDFDNVPEIVEAIRDTEKRLSGRGRVLVRPSGTENLVRVMAEGPDEGEIKGLVESIARTISSYLC
ncbi:MAG: phosphoglucosamine mutase [Candidatus Riflebacteria bacterium HGW-Riflebacteria-1]|jgi:phosphoglucosamine mutase|nr:MAG: phosphoglucosamine mutase [Candidatus Riflebacteria bacterium HGW-Riflebacteria-1]